MERTLPATWRLPRLTWRRAGLVVLVTVNAILLAITLAAFVFADVGGDWYPFWVESGKRVFEGGLYTWPDPAGGSFRYSPLVAYFFAAITPIGYWGWTALHFVTLAALPRRLALLALVSFPFWSDVYNGGVMTFVFVAAATALAGSRLGTGAFLALVLLIPRPLMLPIAAWLLWKRPEWRWPFAAMIAVNGIAVLATGWGMEWVTYLLERATVTIGGPGDLGPARLIGPIWVPIGLALAVVLTWRGRLGLASMAASPYWLGYYALIVLLELRDPTRSEGTVAPGGQTSTWK